MITYIEMGYAVTFSIIIYRILFGKASLKKLISNSFVSSIKLLLFLAIAITINAIFWPITFVIELREIIEE